MPLQWLPLDQSIYNKKSPISEAIGSGQTNTNTKPRVTGPYDTHQEYGLPTDSALERMKAQWAMEDKKKKEERNAAMEKAQEVGLRLQAAKEKEKAQYQQMAQQQQKQQMQQVQQIEENPEPAAKEMFQFMQTVDDETRNRLLEQLFTPIKTGSITMGDKTMETPDRYNSIAQEFINNGWVTFNPKTGEPEFSMPVEKPEKGRFTYNAEDNIMIDTATGESRDIIPKGDIPEKKVTAEQLLDVAKEARAFTTGLVDPSFIESMSPEGRQEFFVNADKKFKQHYGWLLQQMYNLTPEEATKIANDIPSDFVTSGITNPQSTENKSEEDILVQEMADYFNNNPNADVDAYREKYGEEAVEKALSISRGNKNKEGAKAGYYTETPQEMANRLKESLNNPPVITGTTGNNYDKFRQEMSQFYKANTPEPPPKKETGNKESESKKTNSKTEREIIDTLKGMNIMTSLTYQQLNALLNMGYKRSDINEAVKKWLNSPEKKAIDQKRLTETYGQNRFSYIK